MSNTSDFKKQEQPPKTPKEQPPKTPKEHPSKALKEHPPKTPKEHPPKTQKKQFSDLGLNPQLCRAIEEKGWKTPTEIQIKSIPRILNGHDVIGIAQTGTGKTASFTLPLLMKIKYASKRNPRGLILVPTRELCIQIMEHIKDLAVHTDLRCMAIYGGTGYQLQSKTLDKGVDIVIATPGRFMDLYFRKKIITKELSTLIIDEADKMMDMGFLPQLKKIFDVIPNKRQNLLFSATFSPKIEKLSNDFLTFPQKVEVTPQSTPSNLVTHYYYSIPNFLTKIKLLEFLFTNNKDFSRVLIFTKTKFSANNIYKFLTRKLEGDVRVIHGNKSQNARINAINDFSNGEVRFLVSTDVAARGIDIEKISHVINFELSSQPEDYIHRIGRTGRFNKGYAVTLANTAEKMQLTEIEGVIKQEIPEKKLPKSITLVPTEKKERILIEREVDKLKRKKDPKFKGAFHKKKNKGNFKKSPKKYKRR